MLARASVETLLEEVFFFCTIVWFDAPTQLRQAARLARGNGLGVADALVLASLIEAKAAEIYTADPDLAAYTENGAAVRRRRKAHAGTACAGLLWLPGVDSGQEF